MPKLTNILAIAAAGQESLALLGDGTLVAWGDNTYGQTNVPSGFTNVVAVAAGWLHSLALKSDGAVVAWGLNSKGQTNVPPDLSNVVAVAAGEVHSLALQADGTIRAWGDNSAGQTNVPSGLSNVVAVSTLWGHNLALTGRGVVVAWGANGYRQANVPSGLTNAVAIAAGMAHSLALQGDGTVVAWGDNFWGQTAVPAGLSNVVAIASGDYYNLALKADGTVVAWGYNQHGQANVPPGLSNVVAIAAGSFQSLAISDNRGPSIILQPVTTQVYVGVPAGFRVQAAGSLPLAYQWRFQGNAIAGATNSWLYLLSPQLADAGAYSVRVSNSLGSVFSGNAALNLIDSSPIILLQPASQTSFPGGRAVFSVVADGTRPLHYRWHYNGSDIPDATNAVLTLHDTRFDQAGTYDVLVSNSAGVQQSLPAGLYFTTVVAWGNNVRGQTNVPPGLTNVVAVAAGASHSLALTADGIVLPWGKYFQSGVPVTSPANLSDVGAVAAGNDFSVALRHDGTVAAWGYGYSQTNVPPMLSNVVAVVAGDAHSLALKRDGTVVAWGYDYSRETRVPPGLNNVVAVAAGYDHSLALTADGIVVGWGDNAAGQIAVPSGLTNVVTIAAAANYSVALRADGTVVEWGNNSLGATSVPSGLSNVVSIAAGLVGTLALRSDGTIVAWGGANVPAGLTNVLAMAAGGSHCLAVADFRTPSIPMQPQNVATYSGSTPGFSIMALGSGLSYQWRHAGVDLQGATNSWLALPNVQLIDAGAYSVVVSNFLGAITSSNATLSVVTSPPLILAQPANQGSYSGGTVVFRAKTDGSRPLHYQWRFNQSNLPGATNETLALSNLVFGQEGDYDVVVENDFGEIISSSAHLFIPTVIAWGDDSAGQTAVPPGLNRVIGVAAGSKHSLALQDTGAVVAWGDGHFGQTNVPPNLSNVVAIAAQGNVNLALRGDGKVAAWGLSSYGQTSLPQNLSNVVGIAVGGSHCLALQADGTVVAWGGNWNGQTNVPAGLSNVVAVAAGAVQSLALRNNGTVVLWGGNGIYFSTPYVPPGLTDVVTIATADEVNLALRSDGTVVGWGQTPGTNYDPAKAFGGVTNAVAIAGASPPAGGGALGLALLDNGTLLGWGANDSGQASVPPGLNKVVVMAGGGSHALAAAYDRAPVLTEQPMSGKACAGATFYFHARAIGSQPLSYQWCFQGKDIPGATASRLTLTNVQPTDAGEYSVLVTNALGSALSAPGVLTFTENPPIIFVSPTNEVSYSGGTAAFAVIADGSQPLYYQWRLNNAAIAGETNATLSLSNLSFGQAGTYDVFITNAFGAISSTGARLVLPPVVAWGDNGNGQSAVPPTLQNVLAISAGGNHSTALQADGTVVTWGDEIFHQHVVPSGLADVMALAAGGGHDLALLRMGTVVGWGANSSGQTNVPSGLSNVVSISAGGSHSLALKADGTVVAWGGDSYGQCHIPVDLTNAVAIAAGGTHSLALRHDYTVVAWGNNGAGQTEIPAGLGNVVAIAAGGAHSLALTTEGKVVAWGDNSAWQSTVPAVATNIVAIAAGADFNLGLKSDGTVLAWGGNHYGQSAVLPGLTNVLALAAGVGHGLAITAAGAPNLVAPPADFSGYTGGTVLFEVNALGSSPLHYQWLCSGKAIAGATNAWLMLAKLQLTNAGEYSVLVSNSLGSVASPSATLAITDHSPLILTQPGDQIVCPGNRAVFEVVADGSQPLTYQWRHDEVEVPGATNSDLVLSRINPADAGGYDVVVSNLFGTVISPAGHLMILPVVAWGDWHYGLTNVPVGLTNVVAIAAGGLANLGLRADGIVVAWGDNSEGQTNVPPSLGRTVAIAAGGEHNLALQADGTVLGWGNPTRGQIQIPSGLANVAALAAGEYQSFALLSGGSLVNWGSTIYGPLPLPSGLSDVAAIAANSIHGLALKSDGTVVAWGYYADGQPVIAPALGGVAAVAAGGLHDLALRTDGTVVAFGENGAGQASVPRQLNGVVGIAGGGRHSLALKGDGTVVAWGDNSYGQCTVPPGLTNVVAIAAGGRVSLAIVGTSLFITGQPMSQSVVSGSNAVFRVNAVGTGPLMYQWNRNDVAIRGETNATLTLTNLTLSQQGIYSVTVGNPHTIVTSAGALLIVKLSPQITIQPQNQTLLAGTNGLLSVAAFGTTPVFYQWHFNGIDLVGGTNATISLPNLTTNQQGDYSVTVSNLAGSVTSASALLSVPFVDSDGDGLPDAWERAYFGSPTAAAPGADPDGDGLTNLQEYWAGTSPLDSNSVLRVTGFQTTESTVWVAFKACAGRSYVLESSVSLTGQQSSWTVRSGLTSGLTGILQLSAGPSSQTQCRFYRVRCVPNWTAPSRTARTTSEPVRKLPLP